MNDEAELYARFAGDASEGAFAALVRLHLPMVFATALRQLGDRGLAEEVTQEVFISLARGTRRLEFRTTLAGWLYRTTLNQCRQRLRGEIRRQRREQLAATLAECQREGSSTWGTLLPMLDEALLALTEKDRLAVMLHYMEGRPLREVGQVLQVGEDAARKRIHRVLESLTAWFRQRGFTVTSGALVGALGLEGIQAAPPALAASVAATAISSAAASSVAAGSTTLALITLMTSTKLKVVLLGSALLLGLGVPLALRQHHPSTAPTEPAAVQESVTSHQTGGNGGSAPAEQRVTLTASPNAPREKSLLERLNAGDESLLALPQDQVDAFLAQNRTNAESLLAAFRATHNLDYLRLAATKYPQNPAVLLKVVESGAFPDERREWLDRFKSADPNNSLPDYLSAREHFKSGQTEAGLKDLAESASKPGFQDHVTENMLTLEELYLSTGRTAAEAKAMAAFGVEMPHVAQVREAAKGLIDLMGQYRGAGNQEAVDSIAQIGLGMAHRLNGVQDGGNLLGEMVGLATERDFLRQLDPGQNYSYLKGGVQERLAQLDQQEKSIRESSQFVESWLPRATEPEIVNYFDRLKQYGERAALEWLRNRSPAP